MIVKPFLSEHLHQLVLQPAQAYLRPYFDNPQYGQCLAAGDAFSGFVDDTIIGCAGLLPVWDGRGIVWALIANDAGKHFMAIHRAVKRYLDASTHTRIEAHVDVDFAPAQRWIKMLGFENETPNGMRAFTPEGRTCDLYSRVR